MSSLRALGTGFLGFDLKKKTATLYDDGKNSTNFSLLSSIGAAVVAILQHPDITANKYIYVQDYRLTQREILDVLERVTGGEKWPVTHVDSAQLHREGMEKIQQGDYSQWYKTLLGALFGPHKAMDYATTRHLDNEALGLKAPIPWETVVEKVVKGEKV